MYSLANGSDLIHITQQLCVWIVLLGLLVSVHNAQSDEGPLSIKKDLSATKIVRSNTYWMPPYRVAPDIALNRSRDPTASGTIFGNSIQLLGYADTKRMDDWSINIQKQAPVSGDCSLSSSLSCLDTKENPPDTTSQHESYWLVFRKAFHF